jgi:MFS family permease
VAGQPEPAASLWRHRDFLRLWAGQSVSQVGTQVTLLALPLVAIVVLRASTFQVGLLTAVITSAYLLVALPAGVVADRVPKRSLMIGCDLTRLVVVGSVPVAAAGGLLTLGQVYLVALLSGIGSTFFLVSYTSYLPSLIGRDQLQDGNARLTTTQWVAQIAGPGLGAVLVGLVGPATAMTADALSYAVSVGCLLAIRHREPRPAARRPAGPGLRAEMAAGLRYLWDDPILRRGAAWSGTANFFVIMVESLGPVYLIRVLHLRPAYVGVLLAIGAAGGVLGGIASGPLARRLGSARVAWLSMTVFGAPGLLIPAARPGWWVLLFAAGWTSWAFGATLAGIALLSYQQATCPPDLLGRVSAAQKWLTWGSLPLGGLAGGVLGGLIGVHAALWIAVVGATLAGLWLFLSPLRRMRDMPVAGAVLA